MTEDDEYPALRGFARALFLRYGGAVVSQDWIDDAYQRLTDAIDDHPTIPSGDETVVLLGYEGQIDAVWHVNHRPDQLLRALPVRPPEVWEMWALNDAAIIQPLNTPIARYRRVSDGLYERRA